jgi:hypothetical protein
MIVGPHKGIFFVATALMCSASLYGAEVSAPSSNPLARIFTGEPNRLTLPPDFPDAAPVSLDQDESCAHQGADHEFSGAAALQTASTSGETCHPEIQPVPAVTALPGAVSGVAPDARAKVEPVSVGGTVQSH